MSNFLKRSIVAAIGIPIAILIVYAGGLVFASAIALISSITLGEFYKISRKKNAFPNFLPGIIANIALIFSVYFLFSAEHNLNTGIVLLVEFGLIFLIIMILELWTKKPNTFLNISVTLGGLLYVTMAFIFVLMIRDFYQIDWSAAGPLSGVGFSAKTEMFLSKIDKEWCAWFLLNIFFAIWLCDTAAYLFGRQFGKHKLFERISPKKTWEGSAAGFVFAIISFAGFGMWLIPEFPIAHSIAIGAIVGTIGQIGDLAESQLKRDAGVKDSSALIPGHGGALDRFDSIMFVVPVVYMYLYAVILFS